MGYIWALCSITSVYTMTLPALFSAQGVLANQGLLCFHMNVRLSKNSVKDEMNYKLSPVYIHFQNVNPVDPGA